MRTRYHQGAGRRQGQAHHQRRGRRANTAANAVAPVAVDGRLLHVAFGRHIQGRHAGRHETRGGLSSQDRGVRGVVGAAARGAGVARGVGRAGARAETAARVGLLLEPHALGQPARRQAPRDHRGDNERGACQREPSHGGSHQRAARSQNTLYLRPRGGPAQPRRRLSPRKDTAAEPAPARRLQPIAGTARAKKRGIASWRDIQWQNRAVHTSHKKRWTNTDKRSTCCRKSR